MKKIPFIDLHEDIADNMLIISHKDFFKENKLHQGYNNVELPINNQVDFYRLKKANARLVFGASCPFIVKGKKVVESPEPYLAAMEQVNLYLKLINSSNGSLVLVINNREYQKAKKTKKLGLLLHLEGADCIDKNLIFLDTLYNLGIRSIGLTHNKRNQLASGALEKKGGLTKLGKDVIKRAIEKGMIIDLAHLNSISMKQALKMVKPPFMFSHGGVKNDLNHPRNLDDNLAREISERGGIIGISFVPNLMSDNSLKKVIENIQHLKNVAGINNIAIGSDFDGIISKRLVLGVEDVSMIPNLARALKKEGFTEREIEKIFYKNVERKLIALLK